MVSENKFTLCDACKHGVKEFYYGCKHREIKVSGCNAGVLFWEGVNNCEFYERR